MFNTSWKADPKFWTAVGKENFSQMCPLVSPTDFPVAGFSKQKGLNHFDHFLAKKKKKKIVLENLGHTENFLFVNKERTGKVCCFYGIAVIMFP